MHDDRFGGKGVARCRLSGFASALAEFGLQVVGFEGCFAERLAGERDPMMTLHQAVEDRIGDGLVANPALSVLDR